MYLLIVFVKPICPRKEQSYKKYRKEESCDCLFSIINTGVTKGKKNLCSSINIANAIVGKAN